MDVVLAVHGGAGGLVSRELEPAVRAGVTAALRAGQRALADGSVAAVEAAVRALEDDPVFNAGKGSVFTSDATHELDASIMRGSDLAAGAIAGVRNVRNPITAARLVMSTPEVLLIGAGAEEFAARNGLEPVPQEYFWTRRRWEQLKGPGSVDGEYSTVGAVALDTSGDLAAATSTGGKTNKIPGRVGDSPVIGAGTYANNSTVAVSATGNGEVYIQGAAASTISAMIEFGGWDVVSAASEVVLRRLPAQGGVGGVIALSADGTFAAPHSTPGMAHGFLMSNGEIVVNLRSSAKYPPTPAAD
ncbi:MAG: isoaspartyl peptidase/L-asparaginase [Kibdelosporangium sp.]